MNNTLSFGTDGIRGDACKDPFTSETLFRLGFVLGKWIIKKYGISNNKILLGSDTRESCDRIKKELVSGLCQSTIEIFDAGVIPTPALFQIINYDQTYSCGIMISASHNPYSDNGIKLFDARNCKLSEYDEQEISNLFSGATFVGEVPKETKNPLQLNDSLFIYLARLKNLFPQNFLKGVKVVLDCAHGATYQFAPPVFNHFGANVVTISDNPDGKNINKQCGSLYPGLLQKKIIEFNADIGFAFDGDGDRVFAVNKTGEIKDGDDLLALLLQLDRYKNEKHLIGTVMTNSGLERDVISKGLQFIRTPVGDKYIAASMKEHNALLGGENSGHIIMGDYLFIGDGIFVALRVLESLIATNNLLMKTSPKMPQYLLNIPVISKPDLREAPYSDCIQKYQKNLLHGRILVRYSGTENALRVMVEALSNKIATDLAHKLGKELCYLIERTLL